MIIIINIIITILPFIIGIEVRFADLLGIEVRFADLLGIEVRFADPLGIKVRFADLLDPFNFEKLIDNKTRFNLW